VALSFCLPKSICEKRSTSQTSVPQEGIFSSSPIRFKKGNFARDCISGTAMGKIVAIGPTFVELILENQTVRM